MNQFTTTTADRRVYHLFTCVRLTLHRILYAHCYADDWFFWLCVGYLNLEWVRFAVAVVVTRLPYRARVRRAATKPASERIADHLAAEHDTRNQVFRALCPTDPKAAALSAIGRAVRAACKAGINPEAIGKAVARAIDAAQKDAAAKKANADKKAAAKKAA